MKFSSVFLGVVLSLVLVLVNVAEGTGSRRLRVDRNRSNAGEDRNEPQTTGSFHRGRSSRQSGGDNEGVSGSDYHAHVEHMNKQAAKAQCQEMIDSHRKTLASLEKQLRKTNLANDKRESYQNMKQQTEAFLLDLYRQIQTYE
ncbi:uncharacterized protein LOC116346495 [Contarinia nasturtii]|uniref:uncharacterized protein LOC116346495 n=1 Tax=Contarinia nasturtii TaxID=265458 RepID=UPI0012D3C09E|nr:uncharacterized protein LOC116346495 [Contarinia nasturtii]